MDDTNLDSVLEEIMFHEARRHRDEIVQFQEALAASRELGIAIGIVMLQEGLGADDALQLLARASQTSGRPLKDVAADVAETCRLPF